MKDFGLIVFGWALGLLSSVVSNWWNRKGRQKEFFAATCAELRELLFRLLVSEFQIRQRHGLLENEYLLKLRKTLLEYKDEEVTQATLPVLDLLIDRGVTDELLEQMRPQPGDGLSLKTHSLSFLEANLHQLSALPPELQRKIHEVRNALSLINQEVDVHWQYHMMTYDSSLAGHNRERLVGDIERRYAFVQRLTARACEKIREVLASSYS